MSWMQLLYETYEAAARDPANRESRNPLVPPYHVKQKAQIEIVISVEGKIVPGASRIIADPTDRDTIMPVTESSAGRTSGVAAHPLCDNLEYVARDFTRRSGHSRDAQNRHEAYTNLLSTWAGEPGTPKKIRAIWAYVRDNDVVGDLISEGILPVDENGMLLDNPVKGDKALIWKVSQSIEKSVVRWRVEDPGDPQTATWEDSQIHDSWIAHQTRTQVEQNLCFVTGSVLSVAQNHPKRLRHGADGAKLVSSNDGSGFTFRGRFLVADQACSISAEATQKAHEALRWLIARQAYRKGDYVVVAWSTGGSSVPSPVTSTFDIFGDDNSEDGPVVETSAVGDLGRHFAKKLSLAIRGISDRIGSTERIVVLALDSATPGRMGILYYRDLSVSEFLESIRQWHEGTAWVMPSQLAGSNRNGAVSAASLDEIADAAYGARASDQLRRSTIDRLLPCVLDTRPIPLDIVQAIIRRASSPHSFAKGAYEWERTLALACGLVRMRCSDRRYSMNLEENRESRDYLYGRLLAIADHLESRALYVSGEKDRTTHAHRLMTRFSMRPFSTWRTIELSLKPYEQRLQRSRGRFLHAINELIDSVCVLFNGSDFTDDSPLSGEFLLGFHCQRRLLRERPEIENLETEG